MIEKLLQKSNSEKLAKVKFSETFDRDGYEVKIIEDPKLIEINDNYGIELKAQAWKNGKQLGFGKDGTTDIERFRFYNLEAIVEDSNGDIITSYKAKNFLTGKWIDKILRQKIDAKESIKQQLIETIKEVGKEDSGIIKGKIGNTTSTFFSDQNDGVVAQTSISGTWSEIHDNLNGNQVEDNPVAAEVNFCVLSGDGVSQKWDEMWRAFFLFDTSALFGEDVSSATFSVYVSGEAHALGINYALVNTNPASDTVIVVGDYTDGVEMGTIKQSDTLLADDAVSPSSYNDWVLNATGIGNIDIEGITKLGLRTEPDRADAPPTWSVAISRMYGSYAGAGSNKPKLVVVHEAGEAIASYTPVSLILTIPSITATYVYEQTANIGAPIFIDSYSESNVDNYGVMYAIPAANIGWGQPFTNINISILDNCKFYLKKSGAPTGSAVAKLYEHTGTYGVNGKPTGSALATSDVFDVSELTTDGQLITFNFTGINKITLSASTYYVITVEYSTGDSDNRVLVGIDTISPSHSGNSNFLDSSGWNAQNAWDLIFYVYGSPNPVLQLEITIPPMTATYVVEPTASYAPVSLLLTIPITKATYQYWKTPTKNVASPLNLSQNAVSASNISKNSPSWINKRKL